MGEVGGERNGPDAAAEYWKVSQRLCGPAISFEKLPSGDISIANAPPRRRTFLS